jgi:ribosomal protein L37AE/L43A
MRIKEMLSQHRRDFRAIYECEHCGHEKEGSGYDDANFHQNVIPSWQCDKCGEKAIDTSDAKTPKYPAYMTV